MLAFLTQRTDAKNSENAIRNQFEHHLSETTTCLYSDPIKFKAVLLQEKQILAIVCCQTHESRMVVKGQSTMNKL